LKVKDICELVRYCTLKVACLDNDFESELRVITSCSGRPYRFSPLVMNAEVLSMYPEKKNCIILLIN